MGLGHETVLTMRHMLLILEHHMLLLEHTCTPHINTQDHTYSHTLSLTHSAHKSRAKITGLPLPHAGRASAALLSG
jgi:hypothetical protein